MQEIRFDDGAAYERYMGVWSRAVGAAFLDWLAPPQGLRWLDVGCGNGAFTEMLIERCSPISAHGVDPSAAQVGFARNRPACLAADFRVADAMALPFPDRSFDAAVMALVLFFVPEPARGVQELARVVTPGGLVSAYVWDMPGGGFPYQMVQDEMRAMDLFVPVPPSRDASRLDALHGLWTGAGLSDVRTHTIAVERTFADFDEYWSIVRGGPSVGGTLASLDAARLEALAARVRARLPASPDGRIVCRAWANAVAGVVPA